MVFDGGGTLLFGGAGSVTGQPATLSGATWQWDGKRWTQRQDIGPSPRWGHAMAFDSDRSRTVLFGGVSEEPSEADTVAALDDTWEATVTGGVIDAPVQVMALLLSPDTVQPGGSVLVTAELDRPAPSRGVTVELLVDANSFDLQIMIPEGFMSGQETITIPTDALPGDYVLGARIGGNPAAQATLHIIP
jgi:hypothetical protein